MHPTDTHKYHITDNSGLTPPTANLTVAYRGCSNIITTYTLHMHVHQLGSHESHYSMTTVITCIIGVMPSVCYFHNNSIFLPNAAEWFQFILYLVAMLILLCLYFVEIPILHSLSFQKFRFQFEQLDGTYTTRFYIDSVMVPLAYKPFITTMITSLSCLFDPKSGIFF